MNFDEIMKKCCICSENYACLDEVVKYPCECKYIHHKSCLLEWLGYSGSGCPICRKAYTGNYLLQGVYTTDAELPDFEPFYFHPPVVIDYESINSLDSDSNDGDSLGGIDYTGNPAIPPIAPLQLSEPSYELPTPNVVYQFTPDTPLNPLTDPDFSLSIDHSFSIPLYINYNQPPVITAPPLSPVQVSTTATTAPSSTTTVTTSENTPPITVQLFNENFGLNLNNNI